MASALSAVKKFDDGFFIRELMLEKDSVSKVAEALGNNDDEEEKKEEPRSSHNPMEQSFYRKQGIDFLNF